MNSFVVSNKDKKYYIIGYELNGYLIIQDAEKPYNLSRWMLRDSDSDVELITYGDCDWEKKNDLAIITVNSKQY